MSGDVLLVVVVAIALGFDFTNGFHDTANAIATSVSTRALSPRMAVLSAAALNFVGAFFFFKVAATVAKGIVNPDAITLKIILAGLVGAITPIVFWASFAPWVNATHVPVPSWPSRKPRPATPGLSQTKAQ